MSNELSAYNRRINEYMNYVFIFGIPVYLSFSVIDYLYMPDLFMKWLGIRSVVAFLGVAFLLLIKMINSTKILNSIFILFSITVTNTMNLMIYDSGGYLSLYIYGILLVNTFIVVTFRMSIQQNLLVSAFSYLPTIFIIFKTLPSDQLAIGIVLTSFLIGMTALTVVFSLSDSSFFEETLKEKIKHKREELLTKSFPVQMRHLVEQGVFEGKKRVELEECLVGFFDIASSTRIGNELTLAEDWQFKEKFLESVVKRAQTFDMLILNQMGDGILFISDYNKGSLWQKNLLDFYRHVNFDFENILQNYKAKLDDLTTGIKCGATFGQASIGFIGGAQSFYTVMGPTVNLAARLASIAQVNEMAITNNVYQKIYRTHDVGVQIDNEISFKGFIKKFEVIKLQPPSFYDMVSDCASCSKMMSLVEISGHIHILCKNCDVIDHREDYKTNQAA